MVNYATESEAALLTVRDNAQRQISQYERERNGYEYFSGNYEELSQRIKQAWTVIGAVDDELRRRGSRR